MDDQTAKLPVFRLIVLAIVGGALGFAVMSGTLVSYLAGTSPAAALRFSPGQPQALLALAQRTLEKELGGGVVAPRVRSMRSPNKASDPTAATFGRLSGWAKTADAVVGLKPEDAAEPAPAVAAPEDPEAREAAQAPAAAFELTAAEKAACGQIRQLALAALVKDPMNARAYRMLGQVASQEGDDVAAERLMKEAVQRSLRETIAVHWLIRRAIDTHDYEGASKNIDIVLRTQPNLLDAILPSFVQVAEAEQGVSAAKALVASNPPYRKALLSALPKGITDARTPLALLIHLKGTANPPTAMELRDYLNFLLTKKFYDLAYDTWLQFLPDEQLSAAGYVFNGRFSIPISGLAFDWNLAARSGVLVDVVTTGDKPEGRVLSIEFTTGQVDFPGVTQVIMVRPGAYEFKGRFKGALVGRRGLKWHVTCLENPSVRIGESQMFLSGSSTWQPFAFALTVPERCGAQLIKLELDARSASERLVSGTMLFDDIEIARAGVAEPAGKAVEAGVGVPAVPAAGKK